MAKTFQKSFAGGEITPANYARTDLLRYATGARTMRNMFVGRQGGAYNRAGTAFDCAAHNSSTKIRLIPFDLPNDRNFQLEFGANYMRPLKNWKPIAVTSKSIQSITKASTTTITTVNYHGFKIGDVLNLSGVVGMTQINGLTGNVLAVPNSVSVIVDINSSSFSAYTSGGTVGLVTPRYVSYFTFFSEQTIFEMTFQQSFKDMILAHESFTPKSLTYYTDEYWAFTDASTSPDIPTPGGLSLSGTLGTNTYWGVTAVRQDTFEESLIAVIGGNAAPTDVAPVTFNWGTVAGAVQYNIYRGTNPLSLGFLNTSYGGPYVDTNVPKPDYSTSSPSLKDIFSVQTGVSYPNAVGFYQQRQWYANFGPADLALGPPVSPSTIKNPAYADRIVASRIGSPTYFNTDRPLQDDSSISFRLLNKRPQEIRHFLDIGKLLVFTEQGEWVLKGGGDGGITPGTINPELVSTIGTGFVPPISIENFAFFIQKGPSSIVRAVGFEISIDGYRGNDLTINSNHLVDNKKIVSWDFQKAPHPILWSARDDGSLLGLTFLPEQSILAWHRHDFTNGQVESVLRSGDQIGFVIKRLINGSTVRYIEHFSNRDFVDIKDAKFLDSSVTFDGRYTGPATLTLSGGTTWDSSDVITITSSTPVFSSYNLNKGLHVVGADGTIVRFKVTFVTDASHVVGVPTRQVPVSMRNNPLSKWSVAVNRVQGLSHLDFQKVSIFADGYVIASANNPDYAPVSVFSGEVVLNNTDEFYSVIHVGLPITSELETLNIDNPAGESMIDRKKQVTKVSLWLEKSRGLQVATAFEDRGQDPSMTYQEPSFAELKYRLSEGYDMPPNLISSSIAVNVAGNYNFNGRILIRQIDPLPVGILAVSPDGYLPTGGG